MNALLLACTLWLGALCASDADATHRKPPEIVPLPLTRDVMPVALDCPSLATVHELIHAAERGGEFESNRVYRELVEHNRGVPLCATIELNPMWWWYYTLRVIEGYQKIETYNNVLLDVLVISVSNYKREVRYLILGRIVAYGQTL